MKKRIILPITLAFAAYALGETPEQHKVWVKVNFLNHEESNGQVEFFTRAVASLPGEAIAQKPEDADVDLDIGIALVDDKSQKFVEKFSWTNHKDGSAIIPTKFYTCFGPDDAERCLLYRTGEMYKEVAAKIQK